MKILHGEKTMVTCSLRIWCLTLCTNLFSIHVICFRRKWKVCVIVCAPLIFVSQNSNRCAFSIFHMNLDAPMLPWISFQSTIVNHMNPEKNRSLFGFLLIKNFCKNVNSITCNNSASYCCNFIISLNVAIIRKMYWQEFVSAGVGKSCFSLFLLISFAPITIASS